MSLPDTASASAGLTNLRRLFLLRSLAIAGQTGAIWMASQLLHLPLTLAPMALTVALLAAFNSYVFWRLRTTRPCVDNEIFIHLLVDVAALTVLLYFSGGASNPFIVLFMFPLVIAVTILPGRYAWLMAAITIACYSLLMVKNVPLAMQGGGHAGMSHNMNMSDEFGLHVFGMWLGFIVSAALTAHYVANMGNTLRKQQQLLAAIREQNIRDQHIVSLGTLAASTAHELGTPLGTMALLTSELQAELKEGSPHVLEDLAVLKQEIDRCKQALSHLTASSGNIHLSGGSITAVNAFMDSLLTHWMLSRPGVTLHKHLQEDNGDAKILSEQTLIQALVNILDNAADASPSSVTAEAHWDRQWLDLAILDRGPGLSAESRGLLGRLPHSDKEQGLGLGLYLAHAIIERFGGRIEFKDREGGGLSVLIRLPLVDEQG